jgi:hypothetical protein
MPTTTRPNSRVFVAGRAAAAPPVAVVVPPQPAVHPPQCCCPACVGLECLDRTRYFSGQLLTEADLNNEQSYWLAKSRIHNRFLHGWGVVCGMQVVCSECDGWVTVKPGYAVDPCGNDIIVCSEQPFNVIKAINACCTPSKQTSNCSPLRAAPPDTCKDALQKWCITIEYQEQQSRMVAPLKQATPKSDRCSCGGIKGSCGCGCSCGCGGSKNGSSHSSSGTCACSSTQTATAVPTGACEPTRINEGFRLCVVPAPLTEEISKGPIPGTALYQIQQCVQAFQQLSLQVPQLDKGPGTITDPQLAFAAVCNFLATVKQYLAGVALTHCAVLDELSQIPVPPPPPNATTANYVDAVLRPFLDTIGTIVFPAVLDCICMALIPPCPPDPCDDRLCLACVTVQGGKIVDICHFGCRHQLVTFHTLYYWLSIVGLDKILAALKRFLELLCCGERGFRQGLFGAGLNQRENLTSAGITSPAAVNQMMTSFLAQKLGASIINAVAPNAQTVDLRPLVGLDMQSVNAALESYKISTQNITTMAVDADPAWSDDAVAVSAQFAPAAFSVADNLTMYTKGQQVVGFDVSNPVAVLTKQVQQLQQQVEQLTGAGRGTTTKAVRGPAKKKH